MRRTSSAFIPQRDLKDPGKMKSRHATLTRCVKTLEMDDKAKFEEEEDRLCLHTDGLERQTSA